MAYPNRLLPKTIYKLIPSADLSPNHYFVRHTESADIWDDLGKLKIDTIDKRDMFGLSCNLLGIFEESDIVYSVNDREQNSYWNSEDEQEVNDFSMNEERSCFFIKYEHIGNKNFPYDRTINNTSEEFISKSEVIHRPTVCNFWHFELHFKDSEGNYIDRNKKSAWIKNFGTKLLTSLLKKYAKKVIPEDSCIFISERLFIRK